MALTIRLTEEDEKLIEKLKHLLSEGRSSQALLKAAKIVVNEYPKLEDDLNKLQAKYDESRNKHNNLLELLNQKINIDKEIKNAIN